MSREQVSIAELLLSLDSSDLQEAEHVRAAVNHQLSTDRGGVVLSSLVEVYLDSSSPQAAHLLSSIREPHHKVLLEKLNDSISRPGSRLAAVTLLGHLIRNQPPWVHQISQSPLLPTLLRCLKTDSEVVFLITGVLVLITLLPMIPQAGKQHIYDFFDVFGRLTSWSYKNPVHVSRIYLIHLQAAVYSLFHRLYGMFPCNFISYLRLHYSMKENLDTFQEVVKPMLEHVRVHPELVTGTHDYELDPSRWRCYEVHDILIECSRLSLDPLESSCEEDLYCSSISSRPPSASFPVLHLDLTSTPQLTESVSSTGSALLRCPPKLTPFALCTQAEDSTWSPSSHCGLSTPPPETQSSGPTPPLSRCTSVSGVKSPTPAVASPTTDGQELSDSQVDNQLEPISVQRLTTPDDVMGNVHSAEVKAEETRPLSPTSNFFLTSTLNDNEATPRPLSNFFSPCPTMPRSPSHTPADSGASLHHASLAALYESIFELPSPQAAMHTGRQNQDVMEKVAGGRRKDDEEEENSISPLKVLDEMITRGHDAHERLCQRSSAGSRLMEQKVSGGKQQSMRSKGPVQAEELQSLRSQLLLVHSQLQYERFKRQQHAIRNRRLLRRVINATALEEHNVAMKSQVSVLDEEIRCLKKSLEEEQRRFHELQQDTATQSEQLQEHVRRLLQRQQEESRVIQRLQSELQESQGRLKELEAELRKANQNAYNAEHQLTQLSLKVCSSEQLQQQIFFLNQQLVLLKETNRSLSEQLEEGHPRSWTEETMLQGSVGKEFQRLKDGNVQLRQKLEAANHRAAELESQLAKKEQLILDQKKLLEDTKNHSREELCASESRCLTLRKISQALQTEMLHLYSQIHLDTPARSDGISASASLGANMSRTSSSTAVGIINGAVEMLSSSPLQLPSGSISPIESPLAVGSFLEQRARELFGATNQGLEEEEQQGIKEESEEEATQLESLPPGQELEEAMLLSGSPEEVAIPSMADSPVTVQQRRNELSIMDYDESLPEF